MTISKHGESNNVVISGEDKKYVLEYSSPNKSYDLQGKEFYYTTIVLMEYSMRIGNLYQRVKTIADFGNSQNMENYDNAMRTLKFLQSESDNHQMENK